MSLFLRPWSTFASLYSLISETRRPAKRRASSCFLASSLCGPPNAEPRCRPAGGMYCVVARSSDAGGADGGGGGGGGAGVGRCVAVVLPSSSAAALKFGRALAIISRTDAAVIATVSLPVGSAAGGRAGGGGGG